MLSMAGKMLLSRNSLKNVSAGSGLPWKKVSCYS